MDTKIIDSRKLVKQIERVLAQKPVRGKDAPLEQVVDLLYQQRRYSSIGIYALVGKKILGLAYRGPALPCLEVALGIGIVAQSGVIKAAPEVSPQVVPEVNPAITPQTSQALQISVGYTDVKRGIVVPIKVAGRVLGVIDVESDRLESFSYHDQVLLKQVASRLARYLISNGKVVIQKLRMQSRATEGSSLATETNKDKKMALAVDRPLSGHKASSLKATAGEMLHV